MSALDDARSKLRRAATAWVNHIEREGCSASCTHAVAKHYAEARERCQRLELDALNGVFGQGVAAQLERDDLFWSGAPDVGATDS